LIDRRDHGGGYDFTILFAGGEKYVEVKGLAEGSGGVLFTDKEWYRSKLYGDRKSNRKYPLIFIVDFHLLIFF
jgi:hypothetical protein